MRFKNDVARTRNYSTFSQKVVHSSGLTYRWSFLKWLCPFCFDRPSPLRTRRGSVPVIKVSKPRSPNSSDDETEESIDTTQAELNIEKVLTNNHREDDDVFEPANNQSRAHVKSPNSDNSFKANFKYDDIYKNRLETTDSGKGKQEITTQGVVLRQRNRSGQSNREKSIRNSMYLDEAAENKMRQSFYEDEAVNRGFNISNVNSARSSFCGPDISSRDRGDGDSGSSSSHEDYTVADKAHSFNKIPNDDGFDSESSVVSLPPDIDEDSTPASSPGSSELPTPLFSEEENVEPKKHKKKNLRSRIGSFLKRRSKNNSAESSPVLKRKFGTMKDKTKTLEQERSASAPRTIIGNFMKNGSKSETSSPLFIRRSFSLRNTPFNSSSVETTPLSTRKRVWDNSASGYSVTPKKNEDSTDDMSPTLRLRHKFITKKLNELAKKIEDKKTRSPSINWSDPDEPNSYVSSPVLQHKILERDEDSTSPIEVKPLTASDSPIDSFKHFKKVQTTGKNRNSYNSGSLSSRRSSGKSSWVETSIIRIKASACL